jgi:membrane protein
VSTDRPNVFVRVKDAASRRWSALKSRRPSVQHVVDAWALMQQNNGGQYAAAITYFSFLALFPLLLLAAAITGFVLHAHPGAQQALFDHITENVGGDLGKTLRSSVNTAIQKRTGVGIIGLVGVALTGLGWVGNLRAAIDAVWGRKPAQRNFFLGRLVNLLVLAGLGVGMLVSLALTVVGTALTDQLLRAWGLADVTGSHVFLKVLGLLLAVAGDVLIFWWLLVRLPGAQVPRRVGVQGALLAAVGFELLKIIGTFTVSKTAHSPTAGPFAGVVAVLIWIQLVARYGLFCAAWTVTCPACAPLPGTPPQAEDAPSAAAAAPATAVAPAPAAVAAALLGVGAAVGSAATWLAGRRRSAQEETPHSSR